MTELVLDQDQERAVTSNAGAIVVVAGAGCGKTEIVARRIERLLRESEDDPFRILVVSYTVKAADELQERFAARLGDLHRRVDADTIHGFAWSLVRQHGTRIGLPLEPEVISRDEDRAELLEVWLRESGRAPLDDPRAVLAQLDLGRARGQTAPYLDDWRAALSAAGAVDYQAMLDRASELVTGQWLSRHLQRLYAHVIVDEAQNLTVAQYRFLTQIVGDPSTEHLHAALVGDERQSIVGFAGADLRLIGRFEAEYRAERIELRTNYRSARSIVDLGRVVSRDLGRPIESPQQETFLARGSIEVRACATEESEGEEVARWISELLSNGLNPDDLAPEEAPGVQPEQIAVLARAASSLWAVRESLGALGIETASASTEEDWVASTAAKVFIEMVAYRSAPEHLSTRRRVAELCGTPDIAWDKLGVLLTSASDPSVAQLSDLEEVKELPDLISAAEALPVDDADWSDDVEQLVNAWRTFLDRTDPSERTYGNFRQHIARCQRGDSQDPGVRLLTVHKSQGREFRAVAVVACNEGQFPDFRAISTDDIAAELRTFYVAISRPSRALLLTRAETRRTRVGDRVTQPSPFLLLANAEGQR